MKKVLNILRQIVGWIVVVLMAFSTFGSFLNKGYLSAILFMLVAIFNVPQIQTLVFKSLGKIIKQDKKAKKIIIILALHLVALIICFTAIFSLPSSENVDKGNDEAKTTSVSQGTTNKKKKDNKKATEISAVITDKKLAKNFEKACEEIDIDIDKISKLEQMKDWSAGPRYSFVYKRIPLKVYCNRDSTISSIQITNNTKIFEEGFEPYSFNDYCPNEEIVDELIIDAEDYVKSHLNYPSTADFALLDWSYGRDHNLYSVSSYVEAKNGFGVKSKVNFKLIYNVTDKGKILAYSEIDGNVIVNKEEYFKKTERKKINGSTTSNSKNTEIVLTYGQLGSYGKEKNIDGEKYINYCLPAGKYKVEVINYCTLYVAKDKYYKTADGYTTNDIVTTCQLNDKNNTTIITVKSGEHIELTINGKVKLIPTK